MKPVDMISKHDPPHSIGDCFRCCIASLLELPAEAVPHFMADDWGKDKDFTWYGKLNGWLAARGVVLLELGPIPDEFHGPKWFESIAAGGFDAFHVMSGMSPRGFRHSVVARNGVVVHDPHPDRTGLVAPGDDGWQYGFLVNRGCA